MRRSVWAVIAAGLLLGSAPVYADVWDQDTLDEDDGNETDNEMVHGMRQVHDLAAEAGVIDQDWYRATSQPRSSYEIIVDGLTGDMFSNELVVERVTGAGAVLNTSAALPTGGDLASRSLRWQNTTASVVQDFVRVNGNQTSCTTACTTSDQYTIRFYETTTSLSRYNNTGTQTTVLFIQNPANYTIDGTIYFWGPTGTLVASQTFNAPAHNLVTIPTVSAAGATAGHITVSHTGRYGDLQGKSVALEPSTGFSFDTPMVHRPY